MAQSKKTNISQPPAQNNSRKRLFTLAKIVISASLIAFLLSRAELGLIWQAVASSSAALLLLSFLLHGIGYFSSSYRWQILLRAQGYEVPVMYLVRSYAIAMFFNNLLPSTIGGDGYRALDTAKCDIPRMKALATVVVERFLGMFALMAFAIMALAVATELTTQIEHIWAWSLLAFFGMFGAVWFIFLKRASATDAQSGFPFLRKLPAGRMVEKQLLKMQEAFRPFRGKTGVLFWSLGLSLLLQFNVIFHYYLISEALGLGIPLTKFLVIIPLSTFVQMLPISINGIGLRESFFAFILTNIYGVTYEATLAFSWIGYGMVLLLGVLGGVIYAFRRSDSRPETDREMRSTDMSNNDSHKIMDTQKDLFDHKKSALQKYQEIIVGTSGLFSLIKYELIVTALSWIPGALGLVLRQKFYRFILGSMGRGVAIGANVAIRHAHKIHIGDNVVIDDNCVLDAKGEANKGLEIHNGVFVGRGTILTCHNGDIILEDNVNIGFNCVISSLSRIVIKKNHLMAAFCYLVGGDHDSDRTDIPVLFQGRSSRGITIDENVWLGAGVAVLDGTTVGRDSIIGAHAVVNKDVPEFSIAAGVPAKFLWDRRKGKEHNEVLKGENGAPAVK